MSVSDNQGSGHPNVTKGRQDNHRSTLHLRSRFMPTTEMAQQLSISAQTVRNHLREVNCLIRTRRPYTGLVLMACHHAAHTRWARLHLNWHWQKSNNVHFMDESHFNLSHTDEREIVYHRNGERHANVCVCQRDSMEGGALWSGVELWGRGKPTWLPFWGISVHSIMLMKYWTLRLFHFCKGTGLVHCSKTMHTLI